MSFATDREQDPREAAQRGVYAFFVVQVVSFVFLQKLGITFGDKVIPLNLPVYLGSLVLLSLHQHRLGVSPKRLVLYLLFLATAVLSQVFHGRLFSITAMLLMLGLYVPVMFRYEVDEELFMKCIGFFQKTMLLMAMIVFAQQISQRLWGYHVWPDMDKLLPEQFLVPDYNYWRETSYRSGVFQPNGFFFLEVSILSQFLAISLVIEVVHLKRPLWIVVLGLALLLTFAGTGLLVMAATAPFLLNRLSPRLLITGLLSAVIFAIVGASIGWFDQIATRLGEIDQPGTSGYYRFMVPWMSLKASFANWDTLFFGVGAGAQSEVQIGDAMTLPINKLLQEYGIITMFSFFLLFCYALFEAAPSNQVGIALFVFFNLGGGGLSVPIFALPCALFGTLLRVAPRNEPAPNREFAQRRVPYRVTAVRSRRYSAQNST